mgnify:CR=1 FL=1
MTRPTRTWLLFGLSAGLAAAAMGWVSLMAVRLDSAESVARLRAEREERVRLALWRMELAVAPLLAREGSRPYFAYSAFYPAERAYTRMFAEVGNGEVIMPSPLLAASDSLVQLHFQVDPAGRITSPEAPAGRARQMAVNDGFVEAARLEAAANRMAELGGFLDRQVLLAGLPTEVQRPVMLAHRSGAGHAPALFAPADRQDAPAQLAMNDGTRDRPTAAPQPRQNPEDKPAQQVPVPVPERPVELALNDNAPNASNAPAVDQQTQQAQQSWSPKQVLEQSKELNKYLNSKEYQARSRSIQRQQADDNTSANLFSNRASEQTVISPPSSTSGSSNSSSLFYGKTKSKPAGVEVQPQAAAQRAGADEAQAQGRPAAPAVSRPVRQEQSAAEALVQAGGASPFPEVLAGEMRPLWLGGELVLARLVSVDSQPYVQGCWLNWPELRRVLLEDVRDLLPDAELEPVTSVAVPADERMLAAVPVRLLPGPEPVAESAGSSAVRLWLLAAWGGMGLAAAALALLLGGTLALSERRAAFVSAVTHELRSPLTTFRMYAEMLHEGMVRDEPRRRKYLATLRAEAGRLGHLVENVLAYARLENSRRASRIERLPVGSLLERVTPRLAERAAQAGMELVAESATAEAQRRGEQQLDCFGNNSNDSAPPRLGGEMACVAVRADPAAVEQILFNLVDNACKYAGASGDRRIHLEAARRGGRALLRVRDHGPGVNADVAGRMFRPFSRSAAEAAGSAPGVGLGLALSRRLARDMDGELRLEPGHGGGASFVLELPSA